MARILIVDADPLLLNTLSRVLGGRYVIVAEQSAAAALARADLPSFDLFMVDVATAELWGVAFFARVLQIDPTRRNHVIFMSGLGVPHASTHLAKPFSIHDLFRKIETKLRELGVRAATPILRDLHEVPTVRMRPLRRPAIALLS